MAAGHDVDRVQLQAADPPDQIQDAGGAMVPGQALPRDGELARVTHGNGGTYSHGMKKAPKNATKPQAKTISRGSIESERHPEEHAQDPGQALEKIADEGRGKPLRTQVKKALQEIDREVAGTYEAREDAESRRRPKRTK
jgi:hypothetical protein